MADDQRIRPTVEGRARLLQAVAAVAQQHAVDPGALGEYAQLLVEQGPAAADRLLPDVARHLASGCQDCATDVDELIALTAESDAAPEVVTPGTGAVTPPPAAFAVPRPDPQRSAESRPVLAFGRPAPTSEDDSGIHVRDLPDPESAEAQAEARAAAEAQRRQQARRWRERLLIAAAVAVVAMGLSLIGMAYLARAPRETPRFDLAPAPLATPGSVPEQQAPAQSAPVPAPAQSVPAPAQSVPGAAPQPTQPTAQPSAPQPASAPPLPKPATSGGAPPNGMDCPQSHPIKGNRSSMIYHVPGGGFYGATRPEQCFAQPADAEAAGYRRSQR